MYNNIMNSVIARNAVHGDKTHRDWLLYATQSLIANVDSSISTEILVTPNDGRLLKVCNITEDKIGKLYFLTNTDQNNNYLYLESFKVFIDSQKSPLNVPGLTEGCIDFFRRSDINAFISDVKIHYPFADSNITTANIAFSEVTNFNIFIDYLTNLVPYVAFTQDHVKTYELILNPDTVK